jgi:thioredoxin 1
MVHEINDENFKREILESSKPAIVDFWASWCMPCKMMAPIFDKVSKQIPEVKFAKINVEDNQRYAGEFQVTGIPCLIVFKNGKEIGRIVGLQNEDSLKAKINQIIS